MCLPAPCIVPSFFCCSIDLSVFVSSFLGMPADVFYITGKWKELRSISIDFHVGILCACLTSLGGGQAMDGMTDIISLKGLFSSINFFRGITFSAPGGFVDFPKISVSILITEPALYYILCFSIKNPLTSISSRNNTFMFPRLGYARSFNFCWGMRYALYIKLINYLVSRFILLFCHLR